MEVSNRDITGIKRELDVTLSKQEIDPYVNRVYREAQKRINHKGFRPGAMPINLIKKLYGPSLEGEAYEDAINQEFQKIAEEQQIRPVGSPMIMKMDRTDDGGLSFTIRFDVMPNIELGEYKGLAARRVRHTVTEEELDREIDMLRERFVMPEDAEQVENDDFLVTLDLQQLDDQGQPVEGEVQSGMKAYLRRPGFNEQLRRSLLNTRVGDTFRIDLPTGENEETTHYEVTVKEIKRAVLPEVNDEFAQKVTGQENTTVEELRDMILQSLESSFDDRYSRFFRDELIGALLERHDFEVPDVFVAEALGQFIEDMKQGPKKELPADFDREKFIQEMRPVAERTVRWAFLREQIIEKEGLTADDADYEGLAEMESQRTGIDYEVLVNYFKKNPEYKDRILAEKAIQFLEDYAIVQEVEDVELAAAAPAPQEEEEQK